MSSEITNGGPILKEQVLTANGTQVKIIKRQDDPLCLRVSVGGTKEIAFYFVYRGNLKEIQEMLKTCWLALEQFEEGGKGP